MATGDVLPEVAAVHWRQRVDGRRLRLLGRAVDADDRRARRPVPRRRRRCCCALEPLTAPVALASLAHAWIIPELYAQRGANVVRAKPTRATTRRSAPRSGCSATSSTTRRASCTRAPGSCSSAAALGDLARGRGGRAAGQRTTVAACTCWCVRVNDPRPAQRRPHRPPAAGPARRRGGLRDRRQPRVQRGAAGACAGACP